MVINSRFVSSVVRFRPSSQLAPSQGGGECFTHRHAESVLREKRYKVATISSSDFDGTIKLWGLPDF